MTNNDGCIGNLPTLDATETIVREREHGLETIAVARFSNGAQLRYRRDPRGRLWEETVHADDPETVRNSVDVTERAGIPGESLDHPQTILETTLEECNYYAENHAIAERKQDWLALSEVLIATA